MSKKARNNWFIVGGLVAIFGVGLVAFLIWARQPGKQVTSSSDVQGASTKHESKNLSGANFATRIPSDMIVKTNQTTAHADVLEQLFVTSSATSINNPVSDQIGITIGKVPMTGLVDISDIRLRLAHADVYSPINRDELPYEHYAYIKQDNSEYQISVFWAEGQKYASVVVSGDATKQSRLDSIMHDILSNWQWQ